MDPFAAERGKLATYKVDGNQILKSVDGTSWRVIFTYGDTGRLREVCALLNDGAIGNCDWLRKELRGEPTEVKACDDCPLFDSMGLEILDTDMDAPADWRNWIIPGDGHPDSRAHARIAQMLYQRLKDSLGKAS